MRDTIKVCRQHDSMQCGIACLQMVCAHYGREYSLQELSGICFVSTEGVSLLGISEAASKLGLRTVCGKANIEGLRKALLPCILHWNQNHFVVLYKITRGCTFCIADPGKGLVRYNLDEFSSHWLSTCSAGEDKGIAMLIEPSPMFYKNKKRNEQTETRSFRFLFGYVCKYKHYFSQIILGLFLGCLLVPYPHSQGESIMQHIIW